MKEWRHIDWIEWVRQTEQSCGINMCVELNVGLSYLACYCCWNCRLFHCRMSSSHAAVEYHTYMLPTIQCYLCYEFRTQLIYKYKQKVKHENDTMIVVPRCMFTFVLFLSSAVTAADWTHVLFEYMYMLVLFNGMLFDSLFATSMFYNKQSRASCANVYTDDRHTHTSNTFRWCTCTSRENKSLKRILAHTYIRIFYLDWYVMYSCRWKWE